MIIAEDYTPIRVEIMEKLLRYPDTINIVGVALNGKQAVEFANIRKPDVILMDVEMPVMTGLEAAELIKASNSKIKIIFYSAFEKEEYIKRASDIKCYGFIKKEDSPELIYTAILNAHYGYSTIKAAHFENSIRAISSLPKADNPLSDKEYDVACYLATGLTNKQVGKKMYMVESTVKKHVQAILIKLGISTSKGIALKLMELGLLRDPDNK